MRYGFVLCSIMFAVVYAAIASPPLRCITANFSAGGTVLVLNDLTYRSADPTKPRRVASSIFRVFQRNDPDADRNRISDSEAEWSDAVWSVVADTKKRPFLACNHVLATDDAEYLVFVGFGYLGSPALCSYRRRDHPGLLLGGPKPDHGIHVRDVSLNELEPAEDASKILSDSTPSWYKGATFAFSKNCRQLLYRNAAGKSLQVELSNGVVSAP